MSCVGDVGCARSLYPRAGDVRVLVFLALSAVPGFAQTRERPIATFNWPGGEIDVVSSPFSVTVIASQRSDFVRVVLSVDELAKWVGKADSLVATRFPVPPPGEIVKHEVATDEDRPGRNAGFSLTREVRGARSSYSLFLSDEYVVNTILVDLTPARVRLFIAALKKGIVATNDMAKTEPRTQSIAKQLETYYEFQVEKPAELLKESMALVYPEVLTGVGLSGEVQAQFTVLADGTVDVGTFKVLRSASELFTQAVRKILPQLRYAPAEIGGRKVSQLVQQSFQFSR
jgi:hypothetical protein